MTFLENVAGQTIICDGIKNPAGDLRRFVNHYCTHLKEVWMQDTGSKDGTYKLLRELQSEYPNLHLPIPIKFKGFSHARNHLLQKTLGASNCEWRLVMDRDELFPSKKPEDSFAKINEIIKKNNLEVFAFKRIEVYPNGNLKTPFKAIFPRLFNRSSNLKYLMDVWEVLEVPGRIIPTEVYFYHFNPTLRAFEEKLKNWYKRQGFEENFPTTLREGLTPSQVKGYKEWTAFNPQRDNYE